MGGAVYAHCDIKIEGLLLEIGVSMVGVCTPGSGNFSNLRILGNEANATASAQGGFAYFNTGSTGSTFVNCVISGNKATGRYGVYKPTGPTRFVNCSIVGNQSGAEGGVTLLFEGDSVVLENTIMWGNTATTGNEIYVNSGTASANFSLYDPSQSIGTITGTPVSSSDPLFVNANGIDNVYGTDDDDLTLQASSPAIDQASYGGAIIQLQILEDYPAVESGYWSHEYFRRSSGIYFISKL